MPPRKLTWKDARHFAQAGLSAGCLPDQDTLRQRSQLAPTVRERTFWRAVLRESKKANRPGHAPAGATAGSLQAKEKDSQPLRKYIAQEKSIAQTENCTVNISLFELGTIVITANAKAHLNIADYDAALRRHESGDWGELDEHDRIENANALARGGRLFSAYTDRAQRKFWIITEADRSVTTILLPEDY